VAELLSDVAKPFDSVQDKPFDSAQDKHDPDKPGS